MLYHLRNILRMFSLSFRLEAEAFVRSKTLRNFLLAVAFFALSSSPGWGATPIGTVIQNTAQVSFSAGGFGGFTINSNIAQFTVEGLGQTDIATMNVVQTPVNLSPSPGDTLAFAITINNIGDNTLANTELKITVPQNSTITLDTGTLVAGDDTFENSLPVPTITRTFSLQDITSFETRVLQAVVILPLDGASGDTDFSFELVANGGSITTSHNPRIIEARTESTLELLRYDTASSQPPTDIMPTQYDNGTSFATITPPPLPDNDTILVTDQPVPLSPVTEFNHNQPLFFRIVDADQNHDPNVQDTIEIILTINDLGETETLRLAETTPDSGIFTGYIYISGQAGSSSNGILNVTTQAQLTVSYTDAIDSSDTSISIVLVDPYGVIFDSATGAPLDGFTIRLVNAATGLDAVIYGDDGGSLFPATLISGGTAADASGATYNFPTGTYRYPFVVPGQYYLEITPPAGSGYHFPSARSDAQLAGLPNGPFIVDVGSRGETFTMVAGPPLHLDIPIDPATSPLYVQRTASKDEVEQGDFMQFMVSIENSSAVNMAAAILTDVLPQGFRYQEGSARLDGARVPDPQISPDGRTLSFSIGTLTAGTTYEFRYVVAIGAARAGIVESKSVASANGGAVTSNAAILPTRVRNAFMRDHNILVGQVNVHADDGSTMEKGIPGVRIYLEDGTYTITDENGRYHFEGVKPGTHVVQLDLDTLPVQYEIIPFERNTRFAGRAWSKFVDLQGGTLWRVDFHAALKPKPAGHLQLQLRTDEQTSPDQLRYRITLRNQTVPLSNLKLIVMLPEKTVYRPGSSRLGDAALTDPQVNDTILTYRLATLPGNSDQDLTLEVDTAESRADELITKMMLMFDTPVAKNQRSAVIEHRLGREVTEPGRKTRDFVLRLQFNTRSVAIREEDRKQLDRLVPQLDDLTSIRITATGHTDNRMIRPENRKYFANNQVLSEQRALAVANYLRDKLRLTPAEITAIGKGSTMPIADNRTAEGRATNRRVELRITGAAIIGQPVVRIKEQTASEPLEISTVGRRPGEEATTTDQSRQGEETTKSVYDEQWLSNAAPGLEFVSPAEGELPAVPSVTVAVKHAGDQKIELFLNHSPVPAVNFEGTAKNRAGTALSRWSGVDLVEGDNRFDAVVLDKDGSKLQTLSRTIHFSAPPVHVELVPEQSILTADGTTSPVIALRLTDRYGYPARPDSTGEYRLNPPYRPTREGVKFDPALLPGSPEKRLTFKVEEDGITRIKLEPTSEAGEVQITLPLMNDDQLVTARLTAPTRDWILVGFAEGTVGYNTLSGKREDLTGNAAEEHIYNDGQIAFFAKGRISGKWLLTIAYDSDKPDLSKENSLFQTIDPGTYYTVYGDTSRQDYDAASRKKLYLKLERDVFSLLFGDYNTDLNKSRLSGYNRALTGLKSEYHQGGYDVVVFASESNQAFIRDEFQGQGITGPYRLSRQNIVMNSEQVILETRDRFRSERILESRQLARHTDYDIDYQEGTVIFHEPVMQNDPDLNLNFIIIKYESYDEDDVSHTYGGHVQKQIGDKVTVGVSHVNEGRTGGEARLTGVDLAVRLTDNTLVRAEAAHSTDSDNTSSDSGAAYIAEIEHQGDKWGGKAYYNQTASGFGLGQTNGSESGTRKIGGDIFFHPRNNLRLSASAFRDTNLATDANRDVIEADSKLQIGKNAFHLGGRAVREELGDNSTQQSNQIVVGASRTMLDNKLKAYVEREQSVGNDESVDYPTVTRLGVDYKLSDKTSVLAQHEWAVGKDRETQYTQVGLQTRPWNGGELFTGLKHSSSDGVANTAAALALKQKWEINDIWSMDFSGEKSKTLNGSEVAPFNTNVPFAFGSGSDYTAGSIGVTYNPGDWIWTARVERRDAENEDGWSLATSAQTDPNSALSLLTSLHVLDSRNDTGSHRNNGDLRLDLAYRPFASPWTVLDRLELIKETNTGSDSGYRNWRVVNSMNANFYDENQWQIGLQLGLKYVQETIDQVAYNGVTALYGAEARYDINEKWDIGAQLSALHSILNNQFDYSAGLSIGHSLMENVWLNIGYNVIGFDDRDFSRGRSTSRGFFIKFRIKFDQLTVRKVKNRFTHKNEK
jgi:uncharacterized repeat protein (TIGR01451 family)